MERILLSQDKRYIWDKTNKNDVDFSIYWMLTILLRNYELHQKKLKEIKKELDLKKQGKLRVVDSDDQ